MKIHHLKSMRVRMVLLAAVVTAAGLASAEAEPVLRPGIDQNRAGRVPRAADPPHLQRREVRPLPKPKAPPEPYLKSAPRYGAPGRPIDRIPET